MTDTPTLGNIPPTLADLFNRDPLGLTRPEINSIVEELRKQRKNFQAADSEARTTGKRVNAKAAISGKTTPVNLDLKKLLEEL